MGDITDRLDPGCILLEARSAKKEQVISQLVDLLAQAHAIADADELLRAIMKREELSSTCVGYGCAIPHAHSHVLHDTIIAAARVDPPLRCRTPDGSPLSIVFLMAGPEDSAGLHMRLLSKLARLLHDPTFREALQAAKDSQEFLQIIAAKDT